MKTWLVLLLLSVAALAGCASDSSGGDSTARFFSAPSEVGGVRDDGSPNKMPTVSVKVNQTSGMAPLAVSMEVEVFDPEGDDFIWGLFNEADQSMEGIVFSEESSGLYQYVFAIPGTYEVGLIAVDEYSAEAEMGTELVFEIVITGADPLDKPLEYEFSGSGTGVCTGVNTGALCPLMSTFTVEFEVPAGSSEIGAEVLWDTLLNADDIDMRLFAPNGALLAESIDSNWPLLGTNVPYESFVYEFEAPVAETQIYVLEVYVLIGVNQPFDGTIVVS